jgi:hypothetical protein
LYTEQNILQTCGKLQIMTEETIFPLHGGIFKENTAENWNRITKMPKRGKQILERPPIVCLHG